MNFNVGDIVALKARPGMPMTVNKIDHTRCGDMVECYWFAGVGFCSFMFHIDLLKGF